MNYAEAVKELQTKKAKDNFIVVKIGYEVLLVLPYKDGIAFLDAVKHAEQFDKSYSPTRIEALERSKIDFSFMPWQEYERYKLAGLLNITPEEVKAMQDLPQELT